MFRVVWFVWVFYSQHSFVSRRERTDIVSEVLHFFGLQMYLAPLRYWASCQSTCLPASCSCWSVLDSVHGDPGLDMGLSWSRHGAHVLSRMGLHMACPACYTVYLLAHVEQSKTLLFNNT